MQMRIIFMSGGAREGALKYLLDHKENVVAAITPFLSATNHRFEGVIKVAQSYSVPTIAVTKSTIAAAIKNLNCDLLISCGFPYVLPEEVIEMARFALNVHLTRLPRYRGYRPLPYVIMNGEVESGVTIHFLTDKLDGGDILSQKFVKVSPFDTTKSLYRKCREIEGEILYQTIQQLKQNKLKLIPQDESQATRYDYLRTPKDSEVDWNKPLKTLYNEIRAADPVDYPAFFYVEGQKVCIKLWRPNKPENEADMI